MGCPKSFLRSFCKHCTRAGHDVEKCPLRKAQDYKRRKEEALQRTKQWVADGGLERKQKWEQWQERIEQETNASCSTASTVTQRRSLTDADMKKSYARLLKLKSESRTVRRLTPFSCRRSIVGRKS